MLEKIKNLYKNQKENFQASSFFYYRYFFLFTILVFVDQLTKNADQFKKIQFKNYFFAFSVPFPLAVIYIIYTVVMVSIFYYLFSSFKKLVFIHQIAWIFILSGAISNIVERIVLGYVRDWIYFFNGVFNLADGYIIVGVLLLLFFRESSTKY